MVLYHGRRDFLGFCLPGAIQSLKKKNMYEAETQKYSGIILNLERQINMLESATIENQVFQAYKATATTMKKIHGGATVEDVEDALDEIQESMTVGEEISAALSNPIGSAAGEVSVSFECNFEARNCSRACIVAARFGQSHCRGLMGAVVPAW